MMLKFRNRAVTSGERSICKLRLFHLRRGATKLRKNIRLQAANIRDVSFALLFEKTFGTEAIHR